MKYGAPVGDGFIDGGAELPGLRAPFANLCESCVAVQFLGRLELLQDNVPIGPLLLNPPLRFRKRLLSPNALGRP
jgi:hypothetical protein